MMLVSHNQRLLRVVVAIVAGGWFASAAGADMIIFGGPTYDSTTQTGYPNQQLAAGLSDNGVAVGSADKYVSGIDKGACAVRWDASGAAATELGNIGTDSDGIAYSGAYAINTTGTAVGWAEKYVSGVPKRRTCSTVGRLGNGRHRIGECWHQHQRLHD